MIKLLAVSALGASSILHNLEVNDLADVLDPTGYVDSLKGLNKKIATNGKHRVMAWTFVGAFIAAVGLLSIPVVGSFLALGVAAYFAIDYKAILSLKKKLNMAARSASEGSDVA